MVENPVKPRITKSRKNLDKQDKIDLEKQTLSGCLCDSWKTSPFPLVIFDWRTFSRRVTARW